MLEDLSHLELELLCFLSTESRRLSEIRGHTNGLCADDYCNSPSARRAKRVMDYFISQGMRLRASPTKGMEKRVPIDNECNTRGSQKKSTGGIMITKS